jgi:hypothetical protein
MDDENVRRRDERDARDLVPVQTISKVGLPVLPPASVDTSPHTGDSNWAGLNQPGRAWYRNVLVLPSVALVGLLILILLLLYPSYERSDDLIRIRTVPDTAIISGAPSAQPTSNWPIRPDWPTLDTLRPPGLPASALVCPAYRDERYQHIAVAASSSCADAVGILMAANASDVIAGGGEGTIHPVRSAHVSTTEMHCRRQSLMVCWGESVTAFLW